MEDFDPELEYTEDSEIAAAVDLSVHGTDSVFRPIYINQDDQILALTPEDAERLFVFLGHALKFLEDYKNKRLQ